MKLYPRHSVCPHCRTVYRYRELKELRGKKQTECYHCHKTIKVKKTGILVLAAEMLAVYALLNLLMLSVVKGTSFMALFAVNLVPAIAAALILPLYIDLESDNA